MTNIDVEVLNEQLKSEFNKEKNYYNLERYVMSELMSPIEDYCNAIEVIKRNCDLIEGLNLYYIAAYLNSEWKMGANDFLQKLNNELDKVEDRDSAIIYYLNAYNISCTEDNWRKCKEYKINLLKSIQYSKDIGFVNNRYDLAMVSINEEAERYLQEALQNVKNVDEEETINNRTIDYWLSSERFIDEFILGIDLSREVYFHKFRNLLTN